MAVERGAMTNNVEPAGSAAVSSRETNGAVSFSIPLPLSDAPL